MSGYSAVSAAQIQRVVVAGAGTMGTGIAYVCALAGYDTTIQDAEPGIVDGAISRIRSLFDGGVTRGKVTPQDRDAAVARLQRAADIREAAASADLIIEAVPERIGLKQELFASLDKAAPPHAILATNTSSLSITRIAEATVRRGAVIGLHFFNPVHVMKLLEVVRGAETSETTISAALAFARRIGKEPIVVSDTPGFASSRLGVVLGLEAMRMLEQGVASAPDIDRAMELGYNHPMGPLKLTDLVGLDVRLGIAQYLHEQLGGDQYRPPMILEQMVAEGRLGKKSGGGFYEWSE